MRRRLCGLALGVGLCLAWLAAGAAPVNGPGLPAPVQAALDRAGLPAEALGLVAFPLEAPARGLRHQERRAMQPASTMKLLTSVVALDSLGPNARGRTDLLADEEPAGDTLRGPLYLRGGADADFDFAALWQLLGELRERGLRRIEGGLVLDRTLFRPARMDLGQPVFDQAPESYYNVVPDALQLNSNLLTFVLSSDERQVSVRVQPGWVPVELRNRLVPNDKPCADWGADWATPAATRVEGPNGPRMLIELQGGFPRQCSKQAWLNLVDRNLLAEAAVRALWAQLGGELLGATREEATPVGARVLATHQSRSLAEQVWAMNKRSDNPLTRMVYLRLGAEAAAPMRTDAAAEQVVRAWFKSRQIDDAGLVLDNGSGLSRSERISPAQLAALLQAAHGGAYAPELLASLPIVGVDSAWTRRLKDSPAVGRARLKTGTLRNVVSVAGFVSDARRRSWVVVAFINDERAREGRPVLDALVDWVARQGR